MFSNRKQELLKIIQTEKALLPTRESEILAQVSSRVLRNPEGFSPISDAQYAVLSEAERSADMSAKRIDYIISKEIEYLLDSRKISEKLVAWFKKNKVALLVHHVFGVAGAGFAFYLEHADRIDTLVRRLLSGVHFNAQRNPQDSAKPLQELTPEELFAEQERFPDLVQFLVALSTEGFREPLKEDVEFVTRNS
jgi:hypothetical protein